MGFWVFVLIISTAVVSYQLYRLRQDYDETIAELKKDVLDLRRLVQTFSKTGAQPAVEKSEERRDQKPERAALSAITLPSVQVSESLPKQAADKPADKPTVPEPVKGKPVPVLTHEASFARSASEGAGAKLDNTAPPIEPGPASGPGLMERWEEFKANVDWELFTGVKLFAGLGGIALFIGAGFFVKYSIDRNLIPPALRLAISAFVGLMLIIASNRFDRARYAVLRHTLGAGGIGVLYSVVFAATLYYEYLSKPVGFGLLTIVSAAAFVLAVYFRGIPISVLGAVGAYSTPILVNTGQGSLTMLFLYLTVVNLGLYQVVKRLNSAGLLLLATVGTLCTLSLGAFAGRILPTGIEVACVWIAYMALFSVFLDAGKESSEGAQLLSWAGNIVYVSVPIAAVLLLRESGIAPLLIVTAGMAGAMTLAFRDQRWFGRVIPYGAITFAVAFLWAWMRFDPRILSWSFVVILVYGTVGGLGPIALIRKYGLDHLNLRWFRIFPVAMGLMALSIVLKTPDISFWFWPVILVLELMGLLISLALGAALQASLLVLFLVISGISWIIRMPPDLGGTVFYGFLFIAGILTSLAIVYALKKLPAWRYGLAGKAESGMLSEISGEMSEWVSVFPAAGVSILLAITFWLQRPLHPNPGMFTLVCFLSVSLFLSRRLMFQDLCVAVLLSSLFAQGAWIFRPGLEADLFFPALAWSGVLFCVALLSPFLFFKSFEKWPRVWMGWALYEVAQGLFAIWAADHLWPREMSGWSPLILAFAKLPVVALLQSRLKGLPERNAILAFHGGVLLLYVSALPVMLLDQGWLGLTFVFEAAFLLWLNRRVVHEGLRWVSAGMAPLGLSLLFFALPHMKAPGDLSILNNAVLSVAAAVVALGAAVSLCNFPQRKLGGIDLPEYFRWLAVGTGFFLVNLAIADVFAGPQTVFHILPGSDVLQAISYGLIWLTYGAFLWSSQSISMTMRHAGLILVCAGAVCMILLPTLYPDFVPNMLPLWNLGLPTYLLVLSILIILIRQELRERVSHQLYNLLLTLFLITGFMAVKVEMSTFVQPGLPFHLFVRHTPSMAVGSAIGWLAYGLGLLFWPRGLDKPFRIAGVVLVVSGLAKALLFPFTHGEAFGAMTPMLNSPTLVYGCALGVLVCLALDRPKHHWPFDRPASRAFWGVLLGVVTFCVLNIEISSIFSIGGGTFSLLTHDSLAHQLAYSLGWLLYSIGLLVVGIAWKNIKVRWAALAFIVLTSLKIFFMDLWRLGQLYRVASFVGLAAVLILVSFLYQRLLAANKEPEKEQVL
jgi:uncharacterized membrane protein